MHNQEKIKSLSFKKFVRPVRKTRALFNKATGNPIEINLDPYRRVVSAIKFRDFRGLPDEELRARSKTLIAESRSVLKAHRGDAEKAPFPPQEGIIAVSYTHLTLPTILRV